MKTTCALTAAVGALACLFAVGTGHAQGVTKTNILIGQSSPFSGSNKELGDDIREGIQAYFKLVNAAGGVNGRTLELIALDDANDAKRSGENARILIEQRGVLALIGYASATLSLPALPFAEKSKVAFVGPFTGAEPMRTFRRNVYNIRASYADELEKIVDFYATTGMKKFSIIHYDDAVGKENLAAVELALTRRGLKPSSIATLKRNQTDLGATVSDVVKAEPDVVIATTLYKTTGDFIKSARKAGSGAQFASTSFVGASALANELGDQGMGVVVAGGAALRQGINPRRTGIPGCNREITRQEGLFLHLAGVVHRSKSDCRSDPPRGREPDARRPAQDARFDAELQCRRISGRFQRVEPQRLQVRGVDRHQQSGKVCVLAFAADQFRRQVVP